jgi:formylglycine-generating enzyme required for sulfatase activity
MIRVAGGGFVPFYPGRGEKEARVESFWLDAHAVRNVDFLDFVTRAPEWQRSAVPELFADDRYLEHWSDDVELGTRARADAPVTFVSWFAASAYCRARGKRLPSEAEWEYVARADATRRDASKDPAFRDEITAWYALPRGGVPDRSALDTPPNVLGVRGLHGVMWEWVLDWNASLVSADDRQRGDRELARFCGGAAIGASDVGDYPAFMRIAFRSSLDARFTLHHLGFRCAADDGPQEPTQ